MSHQADSGECQTSENTDFLKEIKQRSLEKSLYYTPLSSAEIFFIGRQVCRDLQLTCWVKNEF